MLLAAPILPMKTTQRFLAAIFAISTFIAVQATPVFVGSWSVYNNAAPQWYDSTPGDTGPLAYTGQEAAALLFGGVASDYYISTVSDLVADINNKAWYDVIGYGLREDSESYNQKYLGLYYGPTYNFDFGNPNNAASAFIRDNLSYFDGLNYAFRINDNNNNVPDSGATVALFGAGMLALVTLRRKRA